MKSSNQVKIKKDPDSKARKDEHRFNFNILNNFSFSIIIFLNNFSFSRSKSNPPEQQNHVIIPKVAESNIFEPK